MKAKDRVLYYDLLNICACFCVIALHSNGIVHTYTNTATWYSSLIIECICYWAVPVFLMLSGATLVNYRTRYNTIEYIKKRVERVVIPWILWSFISLIWKVYVSKDIVMESWSPFLIVKMIILGQIESKYWFFIPLFSVYIGIPFLKPFMENEESRKLLSYMAVSYLLVSSFIPVMATLFQVPWNTGINNPMLTGFFIFPILGILLSVWEISQKMQLCCYVLGFGALLFRYIITVVLTWHDGGLNRLLFDYTQFHSILLAIAVFVFFKYKKWKFFGNYKIRNWIEQISACSFGVYLIHAIVMQGEIMIFDINIMGWGWRFLGPFFTYFVALCFVWGIRKTPILCKLMP